MNRNKLDYKFRTSVPSKTIGEEDILLYQVEMSMPLCESKVFKEEPLKSLLVNQDTTLVFCIPALVLAKDKQTILNYDEGFIQVDLWLDKLKLDDLFGWFWSKSDDSDGGINLENWNEENLRDILGASKDYEEIMTAYKRLKKCGEVAFDETYAVINEIIAYALHDFK